MGGGHRHAIALLGLFLVFGQLLDIVVVVVYAETAGGGARVA